MDNGEQHDSTRLSDKRYNMRSIAIKAYFDGRPGHEKQTRSILQALADMTDIRVVDKRIPASHAATCKNWAAYLLPAFMKFGPSGPEKPTDLLIGTGAHTHLPMLLEKQMLHKSSGRRVYAVTCMSPDPLLFNRFDLCCIPAHDEPAPRTNVLVTLGPPCPAIERKKHDPDLGLVLIGGVDRKSHRWDSAQILEQVKTIIDRDPGRRWTISSSPRTPDETCRGLEEMAASARRFTFFRAQDTRAGWIETQYAVNKTVWVTADSISMVYEALSGGCSVGILPVDWLRPDNKFQKSLAALREKKMIVSYSEWLNGTPMPEPPAEPLNEAGRCAREILQRWWPERLQ